MFPQQVCSHQKWQFSADLLSNPQMPYVSLGGEAPYSGQLSNQPPDPGAYGQGQSRSIEFGNSDSHALVDLSLPAYSPGFECPSQSAQSFACTPVEVNKDNLWRNSSEKGLENWNNFPEDLACFGTDAGAIHAMHEDLSWNTSLTHSFEGDYNFPTENLQLLDCQPFLSTTSPPASSLNTFLPASTGFGIRGAGNECQTDGYNKKVTLRRRSPPSPVQYSPQNYTKEAHRSLLQYQTILPSRRKTNRKKGRACLLCGQDKAKVRQ
jgi:hypothetical protein